MRQWDELLQGKEQEFGKETVDKWLRSLKVLRFDACNIYLQAKDTFQSLWFDEHIRPKLSSFVNGSEKPIKVHIDVLGKKAKNKNSSKKPKPGDTAYQLQFDNLDPSFSFENYLVSDDNRVGYGVLDETCSALCEKKLQAMSSFTQEKEANSPEVLNPIMLYGPPGSGKTHLLQAFCQKLARVGYNVIYTQALTFTDHVVRAIRAGNMVPFRNSYRTVDVLIIDNIQQLAKKNET